MANRVMLFPEYLLGGVVQTQIDDLRAVARLDNEQIKQLSARLSAAEGFLDFERFETLFAEIQGATGSDSIWRVLMNLDPASANELLDQVRASDEEEFDDPLREEELEALGEKLPRLIQACPALQRFKKARNLAEITGQSLHDVQLICDLRPVFDEGREQIEGFLPYTTLKVVSVNANGLRVEFEAELSAEQVSDLAKKAKQAKQKLRSLHEFVDRCEGVSIPELRRTRLPRDT